MSNSLFEDLVFSSTGLTSAERDRLARLIQRHGGIIRGDLDLRVTTHLIAEIPKGEKYKAALSSQGRCKIIVPIWIDRSIAAAMRLPENSHEPDKDILARLDSIKPHGELAGCNILIIGFDPETSAILSKITRKCRATRFLNLHPALTHVVMGNCSEVNKDMLSAIKMHYLHPYVVSKDWLIDSAQAKKLLDAKLYQINQI